MKERLSALGIPIHTPTEFEKARGRAYIDALHVALSAKSLPDGDDIYNVARVKVQRLGFSGDIFDYVVDYRMRLDAERGQNGGSGTQKTGPHNGSRRKEA